MMEKTNKFFNTTSILVSRQQHAVEIVQYLETNRIATIIGDAGVGKTYLSRYICDNLFDLEKYNIVWISCNTISCIKELETISEMKTDHTSVIIFDGFSEANLDIQLQLLRIVREQIQGLILITSRTEVEYFHVFRLMGLNSIETKMLLSEYSDILSEEEDYEHLMKITAGNPAILIALAQVLQNDSGTLRKLLWDYTGEITISRKSNRNFFLFTIVASHFYQQRNFSNALYYYLKCLESFDESSYNEYKSSTLNNLANTYLALGDYTHALEWFDKALLYNEKFIGVETLSTSTIYNNIAAVYEILNDNQKSLEYYYKAMYITKKLSGSNNLDVAITYNNIASVLKTQGNYEDALRFFKKSLKINNSVFGENNPYIATVYNNIAIVYRNQAKYDLALKWYKKALSIYAKEHGEDDPDKATALNNIANVFYSQANYKPALQNFMEALTIYERVLGKDHPQTATVYSNIANVCSSEGNYHLALEWYKKALDIYTFRLGSEHPNTRIVQEEISLAEKKLQQSQG